MATLQQITTIRYNWLQQFSSSLSKVLGVPLSYGFSKEEKLWKIFWDKEDTDLLLSLGYKKNGELIFLYKTKAGVTKNGRLSENRDLKDKLIPELVKEFGGK